MNQFVDVWFSIIVAHALKTRKKIVHTIILLVVDYDIILCDFAGSWMHCGYHLTTSIVAPPLLSLPFAFTFLGWTAGIACLVIGALVTFYSYNLISRVLEHYAQNGKRQLRFRDMARDILGTLLCCFYFPLKHLFNLFLSMVTIICKTKDAKLSVTCGFSLSFSTLKK